MKKVFVIILVIYFVLSGYTCYAKTCDCVEDANRYRRFIMDIQAERAVVYNALNLNLEQIEYRECLREETSGQLNLLFEKLVNESIRLKAMKYANACVEDIACQKRLVKNIQKEIKSVVDNENKKFKKCLNREQRSKFSMIKRLERRDYKKEYSKKDYLKSNPQLKVFGNPDSCPCQNSSQKVRMSKTHNKID